MQMKHIIIKIWDQELGDSIGFAGPVPRWVPRFHFRCLESFEGLSGLRVIVDRENELSSQGIEETPYFWAVFQRGDSIAFFQLEERHSVGGGHDGELPIS